MRPAHVRSRPDVAVCIYIQLPPPPVESGDIHMEDALSCVGRGEGVVTRLIPLEAYDRSLLDIQRRPAVKEAVTYLVPGGRPVSVFTQVFTRPLGAVIWLIFHMVNPHSSPLGIKKLRRDIRLLTRRVINQINPCAILPVGTGDSVR